MSDYRGRFAPTPSGPLHFGSLLAALGSWLFARRAGGQWLLRIEDLDPPREVAGADRRQLRTLAAFGLEHDGDIAWQHARGALYQDALERLLASGHAFACHCSRSSRVCWNDRDCRPLARSSPCTSPVCRASSS